MIRVRLTKDLVRSIRAGHPWIYAAALEVREPPPRGALVEVVRKDEVTARGYYDPDGPIAVRVLTVGKERLADVGALLSERVASALAIRRAAAAQLDSDAVRLLHGEGDRVPGLVVDAYATTGVVRFDGAAAEALWRPHAARLLEALRAGGFPLERLYARRRGGDGEVLVGDAPPPRIEIREGPARYLVDVVHGQKTGFFLDQRGNRFLVGRLAAGLDVLNLFAYTGGFSVAAALGGARRVTTVDVARPAIDAAAENLARNGVPLGAHELRAVDAFAFLDEARAAGRTWDLVVCDPPSFAPNARAKPKALAAYRALNRAAADVVAPGGLLATASCSSHVTSAELTEVVAEAVAPRRARLLDVRGAGPDHPVPVAFPEGRYLKFLLLMLD